MSGRISVVVGVVLIAAAGSLWSARVSSGTARHRPVWQKGITYTHEYRAESDLSSTRSRESLRYLRSTIKAEWIALNPFGYQPRFDDPNIYLRSDPPDDHLARAVRDAHELGMGVLLKPHI